MLPVVPGLSRSPQGLSNFTQKFVNRSVARNNAAKIGGWDPTRSATTSVQIIGLDVLAMDAYALDGFLAEVMWPLMDISGQIIQHNAQDIVQVDTQDTRRSIHYNLFTTRGGVGVEVGPTTPYAPHLEYGTFRSRPYPFMIPAVEMMEHALYRATTQIAEVIGTRRNITETEYNPLNDIIRKYRGFLYSSSRALGNVAAITNVPVLAGLRANMQQQAQGLGNLQAVMHGHVIKRYERVLVGRGLGRIQTGVTGGSKLSGTLGPQAGRAYNIFVGRVGRSVLP